MTKPNVCKAILDAGLGETFREFGFTSQSVGEFFLDEPGRTLIFELQPLGGMPLLFTATAAIRIHDVDALTTTPLTATSTNQTAHIEATIPRLLEVAAGHDFYTSLHSPWGKLSGEARERARNDPIMRYQETGYWTVPSYAASTDLAAEEYIRRYETAVDETSHFLAYQCREHVWKWYRRCKDLKFMVEWFEKCWGQYDCHMLMLAVFHAAAGDKNSATGWLQVLLDQATKHQDGDIDDLRDRLKEAHRPVTPEQLAGILAATFGDKAYESAEMDLDLLNDLVPVILGVAKILDIDPDVI